MTYKNIFFISFFQLISAASIAQVKQADRSLLHKEFMPQSQNLTNEYNNNYYDYDDYYDDFYKFDDYTDYPEYYPDETQEIKIKPKIEIDIEIPTTKPTVSQNVSNEKSDYDYYEDLDDNDYYEMSNSKSVVTKSQSTSTQPTTKSSLSILNFLFINTTFKPIEIIQTLSDINNMNNISNIQNISDNMIHQTLFTETLDLDFNNERLENVFKAKENLIFEKPSSTVPSILATIASTNLLEEEYANFTDMGSYYDNYDYYDDFYNSLYEPEQEPELENQVKDLSFNTIKLGNLNQEIKVDATVSNKINNMPNLTSVTLPVTSKTTPTTSTTTTTKKPIHITNPRSKPGLKENFGPIEDDLSYKQEDFLYDNYFDLSNEIFNNNKNDYELEDVRQPELKTPLNSTFIGLTIKELLKSPALIAGICGGLLVGVITAMVLMFFIIYKMKKNKLDDSTYISNAKNSPIYGNFKPKGQNVTLMSSSSVSPNTNLSTGSTSSATTGLLNGNALTGSRLLKYANHSTSLKKSCSILSSDSSSSSPNHDGSFNYAYIKAPTKEFYA